MRPVCSLTATVFAKRFSLDPYELSSGLVRSPPVAEFPLTTGKGKHKKFQQDRRRLCVRFAPQTEPNTF